MLATVGDHHRCLGRCSNCNKASDGIGECRSSPPHTIDVQTVAAQNP